MIYKKYIFLGIFFITISCSKKENHFYQSPLVKKNLSLRKVDQFIIHDTTNSEHTIGNLDVYFASNNNDSLHAFYDKIKRRFVVVNNRGIITQVIGKKGRGPGEIVLAGGFNFNAQDELVVQDVGQKLFKIFNMQGKLVHSAPQKKTRFPFGTSNLYTLNHKIYAPTVDMKLLGDMRKNGWKSRLVSVYNYRGDLIDTLGMYDPSVKKANSYSIRPVINIDKKSNHLISSQLDNYYIQIYDLKSEKRLAWFGRKTVHFHTGKQYISAHFSIRKINKMSAGRSLAVSIYPTKNYILLYFETLTKTFFETKDFNKKKAYIAIYDRSTHACYGDLRLPYILGNVAGGKLYLIEDTNPDHYTVGVYEIQQSK